MSYKVVAKLKDNGKWVDMHATTDINIAYKWLEQELAIHTRDCDDKCMWKEWKVID